MTREEVQKVHLDEVLNEFGMFDTYHLRLMVILGFAYACDSAFSSNYIFAAEQVNYRCADTKYENNTCGVINSTTCMEFVYDKTDSFVAEFELACEDWKRTLVGTVHSIGYMTGLLIIGPLSDRFGRKPIIVWTGALSGFFGITKSFVSSYWVYIALEFFESAIGEICSPAYILNVEIVSTQKRVPYYTFANIGFTVGSLYKAIVAWLLPNWRNYLRALYTPAFLFSIIFLYLVDESPRWMLIKEKKKKAVKVIKKMAKKNNLELDQKVLNGLVSDTDKERTEDVQFLSVVKSTLSSVPLVKRFLVCVVWWTTSTFVNYGMSITSVALQGNKYLNYVIVEITQLPACFIGMYILMEYRRKFPLIWCFMLAGVFCIGQPFLSVDRNWLSIALFTFGKLMATLYFIITYVYTSELFPTYTRNSMFALCSSLGRIGSIVAPQVPLLAIYWTNLPSVLFGILSIIAGLLTFLVPDTANISLPDTVEEAEAIAFKVTKTKQPDYSHVYDRDINDLEEARRERKG